jgi:hypothetical protein
VTPNQITALKAKIDADLAGKSDTVGIAFSHDAFMAFVQNGLIQKKTFGVLGTTLMAEKLPAYGETHFAFVDWELQPQTAKVGG